jgi:NADPH:quinone reductase-like Zn-dependent oxidoreductase
MKAIRQHARGGPQSLRYEDAPKPSPKAGEVLVRVRAAGVIPTELSWQTSRTTRSGTPRPLPLIPGHVKAIRQHARGGPQSRAARAPMRRSSSPPEQSSG